MRTSQTAQLRFIQHLCVYLKVQKTAGGEAATVKECLWKKKKKGEEEEIVVCQWKLLKKTIDDYWLLIS